MLLSIAAGVAEHAAWAGGWLLLLLGPAAISIALVTLSAAFAEKSLLGTLGPRLHLAAIGWLGTAVHELGHALFCPLFAHRIDEIRLFDPSMSRGSLGYVSHSWNSKNPWAKVGNLLIGLGPILLGTALIATIFATIVGARLEIAPVDAVRPSGGGPLENAAFVARATWSGAEALLLALSGCEATADWRLVPAAYLSISVGASMHLSGADLRGAVAGLLFIVVLGLVETSIARWMGWSGQAFLALALPWYGAACALVALVAATNLTIGLLGLAAGAALRRHSFS
ncbi:MAG: hypothetical protein R6V85_03215 [Polyangia bacterium]